MKSSSPFQRSACLALVLASTSVWTLTRLDAEVQTSPNQSEGLRAFR